MSEHRKSVHVKIEGRVQGVWYRGWTVKTACRLGLDGWVRNQADGSVEAVFSGTPASVDTMIERCRRGPPAADVRAIHESPFEGSVPEGFHQR